MFMFNVTNDGNLWATQSVRKKELYLLGRETVPYENDNNRIVYQANDKHISTQLNR